MKYIAFVLGLAAVTLFLLGYLQKTRKRIILLNVAARVLYILQYLLLSAFEGVALDIAGIVSSALAQKKEMSFVKKYRKWVVAGVNLMIVAVGMTTYQNIFSFLPICGVLLHAGAFWLTDEKWIRRVSLLGCPFWFAYNFVSGAYGSCIGDFLSIGSLLVAMYRYDWKK